MWVPATAKTVTGTKKRGNVLTIAESSQDVILQLQNGAGRRELPMLT